MDAVVGRDPELAAIAAFLELDENPSRVLFLEGEAGIGKTTVWTESARAASELGYRVLKAQPLVAETPISFAAVGDLLAGVLEEVVAELPSPQRRALEVALLLEDPDGPPPELQAIAFAFMSALRVLAGSRPTLVAVDDIQWLDPASASVLLYAAPATSRSGSCWREGPGAPRTWRAVWARRSTVLLEEGRRRACDLADARPGETSERKPRQFDGQPRTKALAVIARRHGRFSSRRPS